MRVVLHILLLGAAVLASAAYAGGDAQPAGRLLVHFHGIGGQRWWDTAFVNALREGGLDGEVITCNWTDNIHPLTVLRACDRNRREASAIARLITERYRQNPARRIYITGHSGGAAIAVWALEDLPDDVVVEAVALIAPALSPDYDLSRALRRVRTRMYVFSSPRDRVLLDWGTRLLCTMDGRQSRAAGLYGFVMPAGADVRQYAKLSPQPYRTEWLRCYGNLGSHICAMRPLFARLYIAPLLLTGRAPAPPAGESAAQHAAALGRQNSDG